MREIGIVHDDAEQVRRDAMTLDRWHELECGTGGARPDITVAIERDDDTGRCYRRVMGIIGGQYMDRSYPKPDRETPALRVARAAVAPLRPRGE